MSQKISEAELIAVKEKFNALLKELETAGLRNSTGLSSKRKFLMYVQKRTGVQDVSLVSQVGWEKFFRQVDGLRFDLPGLAKYINSFVPPAVQAVLPFTPPVQPVAPVQPVPVAPAPVPAVAEPAFSSQDIEMLHDAGISPASDTRSAGRRYWREIV